MNNEQSAAKLLNLIRQEERSETISKESRTLKSETEGVYIFKFYALIDPRNKKI